MIVVEQTSYPTREKTLGKETSGRIRKGIMVIRKVSGLTKEKQGRKRSPRRLPLRAPQTSYGAWSCLLSRGKATKAVLHQIALCLSVISSQPSDLHRITKATYHFSCLPSKAMQVLLHTSLGYKIKHAYSS